MARVSRKASLLACFTAKARMTGFDTRLIVRNTGWLYLRSFAVCGADLVTARIVLQGLGVDGFGLYAAT